MNTGFALALSTHVITGVIAVIATFLVVLALLKSTPDIKRLRITSVLAALSYYISWFTGGYYYWFHYGSNVKPVIKAGEYPWAHLVVMEAKEHIFLLLPVMSLLTVGFMFLSSKRLQNEPEFKSAVTFFVLVSLVLAVLITLAGMVITGGAR